jgi:hypothetical protein
VKELTRNQKGSALLVLLVIFLPLLVFSAVCSTTVTQSVTVHDVDLQKAIEIAAKAAAMQVMPESQADGTPQIKTNAAQNVFHKKLADNLGLDEIMMEPFKGSMVERPDYVLIVYNTKEGYDGVELARKYTFSEGTLNSSAVTPNTPAEISITNNDIYFGSTGAICTTLSEPGIVALVNTKMVRVDGAEPECIRRWAASKVVYKTEL